MTSHKQFGRAPLDASPARRDPMPRPYDFSDETTALHQSVVFAIRCIAGFLCFLGVGVALIVYFLILTQPPATF